MANKRQWKRVRSISLPYVEPGESVRSFARAQTFNPLWVFSYVPLVFIESFHHSWWPFVLVLVIIVIIVLGQTVWKKKVGRIVVITDRRVLVWATNGQRNAGQPEFLRELPRGTMIGSASGNFWKSFNTLGEHLYLSWPSRDGEEQVGART